MKNSPISTILASRVHGVIAEAQALKVLPHAGLRGRYRELALTRLIAPLMPPSCIAMHGSAVDTEGRRFASDGPGLKTEDDVLVVDRDRVPAFLFAEGEGIVPIEAVLAKIEVKSVLTSAELRQAIAGAMAFLKTPLVIPDEDLIGGAALQCVFAFDSDMREKNELSRLLEMVRDERWPVLEGRPWKEGTPPIHALCVVGEACGRLLASKMARAHGVSVRPMPNVRRS